MQNNGEQKDRVSFLFMDYTSKLLQRLFQALRNRARKQRASRKPNLGDIKPGSIIENIAHTRR